jgi:hypothetical protein
MHQGICLQSGHDTDILWNMNPQTTNLLDTILKAIVAYFALEAIFVVVLIALFVSLVRNFNCTFRFSCEKFHGQLSTS